VYKTLDVVGLLLCKQKRLQNAKAAETCRGEKRIGCRQTQPFQQDKDKPSILIEESALPFLHH
jgi:hypothetical protein